MRVFRYEIPVDDQVHEFELTGPVLHVASRHRAVVEFWAEFRGDLPVEKRAFQVYGTGHYVNDDATYQGSAFDASTNQLVWHLYELSSEAR